MNRRNAVVAIVALALTIVAAVALFHRPIVEQASIRMADRDVAAAFHKRRLNFVVLGKQEDEGNTDTIILAHLDLDRRMATLVSIPRDTWVAVPHHGHQKINSAYGFGGAALTAKIVAGLTGAHVDATLAIDPVGAKQLVDALGGLNIKVEKKMDYDDNYGNLHIHLKPGEQYLDGGQTLGYMRFRHDAESDFGRMRRQQQVLHQIVKTIGEPQNWPKIPRLVTLARKDVTTALNDGQLRALVELYRGVPPDNVRSFTLPGRPAFVGDASVVLVDERWAKLVGTLVCAPNEPPQDVVLVANATGESELSRTVVGALRGGGWNVQTFVDEPTKAASEIVGATAAARLLERAFGPVPHRPGRSTILRLGADARPST
ncbi:MAG: LCP family protein [Vulcanimicrobiaceae bacterium]